jgi:hypothetical protein
MGAVPRNRSQKQAHLRVYLAAIAIHNFKSRTFVLTWKLGCICSFKRRDLRSKGSYETA